MKIDTYSFQEAFDEVSASSAGGAPFLIAYGLTFLITGVLSYFLNEEITSLLAMFQGGLAIPAAFWLERRLGWGRMSDNNPLRSLSVMLAVSQSLAIPALIVAFNLNPRSIPVILAGIAGMHFLPYMWLHRSRIYAYVAVSLAVGTFVLLLLLGSAAFHINLLFVGVVYLISAPALYRHAKRITGQVVSP